MTMSRLGSKKCFLLSLFMAIIMLVIYEFKFLMHEKTGIWSNIKSRYMQVPILNFTAQNCIDPEGKPYLIPKDPNMKGLDEAALTNIYWKYINTIQALCRNQTRLGSLRDGGKEVCIDNKYRPSSPCLVYSFGSNYQFDFESAVRRMFSCEIHTFDPSMVNPKIKRPIPSHLTNFHKYGLDGKDFTNTKKWEMRNLTSIRKELKHETRVIDILKIDIEGGEWHALPEIFKSGVFKYVKQICIEIHFGWRKGKTLWGEVGFIDQLKVLRQLYEHGFSIFMRERNMFSFRQAITTVNEISLINMNWRDSS